MSSALSLALAIFAGIAAGAFGLFFILSFVAWCLCEPAARVGRYAPKPLPALALFTLFACLCYSLAP